MADRNKKNIALANLGLFFAALFWGTSFSAVKAVLSYIPTLYLLAIRFTVSAAILAVVFRKRIKAAKPRDIVVSLLIGLVLLAGNSLQTAGCNLSTAGKTAFITTMYVVFVPLINWLMYKKRPKWFVVLAAALALAGIALISLDGSGRINLGDLLVFISGIMFALQMVLISHYAARIDPFALTVFQMGINAVLSWAAAPLVHGLPDFSAVSPGIVLVLVYLTLFCTLIAFVLQNICLKYTSASTCALICSLESVFGVLFSMLLLNERPTLRMYCGFALVFAAIITATTRLDFLRTRSRASPDGAAGACPTDADFTACCADPAAPEAAELPDIQGLSDKKGDII